MFRVKITVIVALLVLFFGSAAVGEIEGSERAPLDLSRTPVWRWGCCGSYNHSRVRFLWHRKYQRL